MRTGGVSPGAIVAAVLLPPLGVYLVRGMGAAFWISTLLTVFWWIPGVVFALIAILAPDRLPGFARG